MLKFRGRSALTEKYVLSDSISFTNKKYCAFRNLDEGKRAEMVYSNSISQFVGYDELGREVYSGDVLVNSDGKELTVKLVPIIEDSKYEIGDRFKNLTLKGDLNA